MPRRPESKSLGSIRNFFACLPVNSQTILADDETIGIIEFMLKICPNQRPSC